jgi:hypothetical protein
MKLSAVVLLGLVTPAISFAAIDFINNTTTTPAPRTNEPRTNAPTTTSPSIPKESSESTQDRHFLDDAGVKQLIIKSEISAFQGDCPCPYSKSSVKANNSSGLSTGGSATINVEGASGEANCGDNSEYYKADQDQKIHCYPDDLTDSDVYNYRMMHNIPDKDMPWQTFPKYTK